MSEKSFTIATTNFGSTTKKHLRFFYFLFSLKDTLNNTTLLAAQDLISIKIIADKNTSEEEIYTFVPQAGYQQEKIPLKHTHQGVWWDITITTSYDITCEMGECLIIPIQWRK